MIYYIGQLLDKINHLIELVVISSIIPLLILKK